MYQVQKVRRCLKFFNAVPSCKISELLVQIWTSNYLYEFKEFPSPLKKYLLDNVGLDVSGLRGGNSQG